MASDADQFAAEHFPVILVPDIALASSIQIGDSPDKSTSSAFVTRASESAAKSSRGLAIPRGLAERNEKELMTAWARPAQSSLVSSGHHDEQ
jgi:hypothetical protein